MTWTVLLSLVLLPLAAFTCYAYAGWMRSRSMGQRIRTLGPATHHSKAGTPTAGGTVVLLLWGSAVLLLGLFRGWPAHADFVVACGLGFGALGLLDDLVSFCRRSSHGLSGRQKILGGILLSAILLLIYREVLIVPQKLPFASVVLIPPLGAGLLCGLLLLATTNSANLTDGLDGLAAGAAVLVLGGLLLLSPDSDTAALVLPLLGALLGFLWLNVYPAQLFLGDVGAFGLGGVIGALAWVHGAALLLPILAGVFVLEALSVLLQVTTFRLTGRRLLKMAPLHHHFEDSRSAGTSESWLPGFLWPEPTVTARLLVVQAGFVLLALWAGGRIG